MLMRVTVRAAIEPRRSSSPPKAGGRLSLSGMRTNIKEQMKTEIRDGGDVVLEQALAILDEVARADTRTSCSALVSVCQVTARRDISTAALRVLTNACLDLRPEHQASMDPEAS